MAGEIDVGFFIVALNADLMQRLLESQDLQLLSVDHAPALKTLYSFLDALTIPDAIYKAVRDAAAGDLVLIAGKGHEKYQEIGGRTLPFDDVAVVREALEARRQRVRVG